MPFLYFSKNFNQTYYFMRKLFLILLFGITLISCEKKYIYREFENEISAQRWTENDIKKHEFEILEEDKYYKVFIEISHVRGTEMDEFPVSFEVKKPDGTIEKGDVMVNFKNTDCLGDVCDVKFLVKEKVKLKKGKYKVQFSPKSKFGFVPNIIGVGLSVERAE